MYYAENPDAAHDVHELRVDLLGQKMTFLTDAGVFSKKMIDFGSQLLLRCLDVEKGEKILDVGCGYGPIGLSLVKAYGAQATMVDINNQCPGFSPAKCCKKQCSSDNLPVQYL